MDHYLAFSYSPIGPKKFKQLFEHFQNIEKIWHASSDELSGFGIEEVRYSQFDTFRKDFDYQAEQRRLKKLSIAFVQQNSESYPSGLLKLDNPPIGIYVRGDVNALSPLLSMLEIRGIVVRRGGKFYTA